MNDSQKKKNDQKDRETLLMPCDYKCPVAHLHGVVALVRGM